MRLISSCLLLFISAVNFAISNATDNIINHPNTLITWLREKGGIFNSKIDIIHNADHSVRISALKDIPPNEILFRIPPPCLITGGLPSVGDKVMISDPDLKNLGKRDLEGEITFVNPGITFDLKFEKDDAEDQYEVQLKHLKKPNGKNSLECDAIRALVDEMKLGNKSNFEPYVNYLLEPKYSLKSPRNWSEEGKTLLSEVLNDQLPPHNLNPRWQQECDVVIDNVMNIPISHRNVFIPFFDMIQHHTNKQGVNTKININLENGVTVYASRDIKVGEQISAVYSISMDHGTAEVLRDYGEVQDYPQIWSYPKLGMIFEVYKSKQSTLQVKWIKTGPLNAHSVLKDELQRLMNLNKTNFPLENNESVPKNELTTINKYLQALIAAIQHAIPTKPDLLCNEEYVFDQYTELERIQTNYQLIAFSHHTEKNDVCLSLGENPDELMLQQCSSYRPHYHEMFVHYTARFLDEVKRVAWIGGGDSMLLHEILKYPSLELVMGLEIDQIVTRKSFQYFGTKPHWNNPKVQWWYGDAAKSLLMLPKEYFGTFDLVLVDLSETVLSMSVNLEMDILTALGLLLKPQGILVKNDVYFHSLSKVFKYTMELDYENPLPIPYLCVQPLVYGSNQVDFLTQSQKEYDVEVLWQTHIPKPLNDTISNNEDTKASNIWYNYGTNDVKSKSCQEQAEFEKEPEIQDNSPGILMLLETEGISIDSDKLIQPEKFSKIIENALETEGLSVITSIIDSSNNDDKQAQIVTLLKQGYVVSRTWPSLKYCAFDVHLWSSFEKLESIKESLITNIQSKQVSSYRIVAGGVFGISTWKEDATKRGPRFSQTCDAQDIPFESHTLQDEAPVNAASSFDLLLKETISSLIADDSVRVGVICGHESKNEACNSLDIVKNHDKVSEVLELWTCPNLKFADNPSRCKESLLRKIQKFTEITDSSDLDPYDEDHSVLEVGDKVKAMLGGRGTWYFGTLHYINADGSLDVTYDTGDTELELEPQYVKRLTKADLLLNQSKLRVLIIDSSASVAIGKVMHDFDMRADKGVIFSNNMLILSPIVSQSDRWKMTLLKNYYDQVSQVEEPVYFTDVMLYSDSDDSAMGLGVLSSGDYSFIPKLNNMTSNVNQASIGFTADVKAISRGDFFDAHSLKTFSQNYLPDDYDATSSLTQWYSQKPLGRQTIFQLAKIEEDQRFLKEDDKLSRGDRVDVYYPDDNTFYPGTVEEINEDSTTFIAFDDGDEDAEVKRNRIKKSFKINEEISISSSEIKKAIESLLFRLFSKTSLQSTDIGDGSVHIAQCTEGSMVVLWDGKNHVDVNLFTYDQKKDFHDEFSKTLVSLLPVLQVSLLDTQPRGMGDVVNFSGDIAADSNPIWA